MGALARHIQRLERMALPPTGGPRVIRLLSSRQLRRHICWFWPVVQWPDRSHIANARLPPDRADRRVAAASAWRAAHRPWCGPGGCRTFARSVQRWFDLVLGLKRLAKTRAMPWSDEPTGATYQKLDDAAFTALFNGLASRPRRGHVQFDPAHGAIMADMLRKVAGSWVPETHEAHRISLTIARQDLWPIPRYFQGAF